MSVIICSFNGEQSIGDCLEGLMRQTYPHDRLDIIVVDDGSSDQTATIAGRYPVRLRSHKTNLGVAHARNTGLAAARGSIVAYLDDDCAVRTDWLHQLVQALDDPTVVAAGGKIVAYKTEHLAERFMEALGYGNPAPLSLASSRWARLGAYLKSMFLPVAAANAPMAVQAVYTANVAYRRAALVAIGGFDSRLRSDEDVDVSARLRAAGGTLLFAPRAVARHRHHERLWHFVRQVFYRAANTYHYYRREGRSLPLFPAPFVYVAVLLAAGVLNIRLLPAAAVGAPLLLYGWWLVRAVQARHLEYVAYGYLQLAVELASMAGLLRGYLQRSQTYAAGQYALRSAKQAAETAESQEYEHAA